MRNIPFIIFWVFIYLFCLFVCLFLLREVWLVLTWIKTLLHLLPGGHLLSFFFFLVFSPASCFMYRHMQVWEHEYGFSFLSYNILYLSLAWFCKVLLLLIDFTVIHMTSKSSLTTLLIIISSSQLSFADILLSFCVYTTITLFITFYNMIFNIFRWLIVNILSLCISSEHLGSIGYFTMSQYLRVCQ